MLCHVAVGSVTSEFTQVRGRAANSRNGCDTRVCTYHIGALLAQCCYVYIPVNDVAVTVRIATYTYMYIHILIDVTTTRTHEYRKALANCWTPKRRSENASIILILRCGRCCLVLIDCSDPSHLVLISINGNINLLSSRSFFELIRSREFRGWKRELDALYFH